MSERQNERGSVEGPGRRASSEDVDARQHQEARLSRAVEAAPCALLMVDAQRRIVLVNRCAEELFGYTRSELLGQAVDLLIPETARARHAGQVAAFLAAPSARPMGGGRELWARHRDGSAIPVEIGLNGVETPDGPCAFASLVDIRARKRLEDQLRFLGSIVESTDDAVIATSPDGVICAWNPAAERLYGIRKEEALGQRVDALFLGLGDEAMAAHQHTDGVVEVCHRHRELGEVHLSLRVSSVVDGHGHAIGRSMIARDITGLKRRDAELQRSNAELEQFAYVASHDLQEPLRMVANYTELLRHRYGGQLDERAHAYLGFAADGARRLQGLVADLLSYSRVGGRRTELTPVSVQDVLESVLVGLARRIEETGARVSYARPLPQVMADRSQLAQVLQNLLENALKFRSDAAPELTLTAERREAHWQISVRDNGIGLDMQHQRRIFEMFQRLHERARYDGNGIGLAVAKRIVERFGGRIGVESAPGQGATFWFTLQAAPDDGA